MTKDATTGSPPMIGKRLALSEWRDYVASYDFGPVSPSRLVLHHTVKPTEVEWSGLPTMLSMQNYYSGLGWTAAPHIYAAPDGIWLFTPMRDVGVHAGIGNSGYENGQFWYSIGLEMVGDFDRARPRGAVWDGAVAVMGELALRLNIPPSHLISFHRDYTNQKSCPGWTVTKDWVFAHVEAWCDVQAGPSPYLYTIDSPILGAGIISAERWIDVILRRPHGSYTRHDIENVIIPSYITQCAFVGVNGDLALAQMCHETDYLDSWWSQRPRRNPAGIGVTGAVSATPKYDGWARRGDAWDEGCSFGSWDQESIPAHLGRLLAYALTDDMATEQQLQYIEHALSVRKLPNDYRGIAPTLRGLGGRWAKSIEYGGAIARLANEVRG